MNSLPSTFGMHEMEVAAETILRKISECRLSLPPGYYLPISLSDFQTEHEMVGFLELIYGGFMTKQSPGPDPLYHLYTYNGQFVPTREFFDRVESRTGAAKASCGENMKLRSAKRRTTSAKRKSN